MLACLYRVSPACCDDPVKDAAVPWLPAVRDRSGRRKRDRYPAFRVQAILSRVASAGLSVQGLCAQSAQKVP